MRLSELADLLLGMGSFLAGLGTFLAAIKKKPTEHTPTKARRFK